MTTTAEKVMFNNNARLTQAATEFTSQEQDEPALFDIPLPQSLQHLVASFLPFKDDRNFVYIPSCPRYPCDPRSVKTEAELFAESCRKDQFHVEDLCRRTNSAFAYHLQAIAYLRVGCANPLFISDVEKGRVDRCSVRSSFSLFDRGEAGCELTPFSTQYAKDQCSLHIVGMPYNDEQLEILLSQFHGLTNISLKNCPNLVSLQALSKVGNLKELNLDLPHLQNSLEKYAALVPLKQLNNPACDPRLPSFDLSKLALTTLRTLSVTCGPELRVVDATNCLKLRSFSIYTKADRVCPVVVDLRGLSCKARGNHGQPPGDWAVIVKGESPKT